MTDLSALPRLGVGISCEFSGGPRGAGLDAVALARAYPDLVHFLEVGVDTARGLDAHMRSWAQTGLPCTYHFLDLNLAEVGDLDDDWLAHTLALVDEVGATWLCGDAGYWHLGRRERGHELLLPPILCASAAQEMSRAVRDLIRRSGRTVLPENPPATAYVGPMHLLEFFAQVVEGADTGLLLDAAHLAVFQHHRGHDPLDGLADFPLERVVEMHVAGGTLREHRGYPWIEDTHGPEPLDATWEIVEFITANAPNLKAVIYEAEHNAPSELIGNFERLNALFPKDVS
ncbi:MAG: DUF692 domain-containing protein [Proteobacteria bacterium]|nr:DUF692 domain-containing protein [Pseudomonadota bacterium]MCP4915492.1 DUF692 domain-containing protein [Pseudomonadota bacterium]